MAGIGSSLSSSNATDIKISHVTLTNADTEYSLVLQPNCKSIEISSQGKSTLKVAFVSGETSTNYKTIFRGNSWLVEGFNFFSKTMYIQGDLAGEIVEVVELF